MLRPLRLLLLCGLASCAAEPACVDGIGRPCTSSADCTPPDGCREVVGAGFFCAPPDGSGMRIVGAALSTSLPTTEGTTASGITVRAGRFRGLPRAEGRTSTFSVVEGDLR